MKRLLSVILSFALIMGMTLSFPMQQYAFAASGETYTVNISGTFDYDGGQEMIDDINAARAEQGASSLELDSDLTDAAMQRAAELAYYYSHTRPDGTICATVNSRVYAENIAAGGLYTADDTFEGWMNSDGHRKNMMNSTYTKIGIGHFQHNGHHFWVQLFGLDSANYSETRTGSVNGTATVTILEGSYPVEMNRGELTTGQTVSLTIGDTYSLTLGAVNAGWPEYVYCYFDDDSFNWSSSDTSVATVSADGVVTAKGIGQATIKASAKTGSISDLYYTVHVGKDLSEVTVSDIAAVEYTGAAYTPQVVLYDGSTLLKENQDYTLSYRNNVNAGTAYVDIIGMGDYGGTLSKAFTIKALNLSSLVGVSMSSGWDSSGYSSNGAFLRDTVTVTLDGATLTLGEDYYIAGVSTSGSTPISFTIRYQGNYTGTTVVQNLEARSVFAVEDQEYTGKAVTPSIYVSGLTEGVDYQVTYSNNVNVGTATATIKGIGYCQGTLTTTFKILNKMTGISASSVTVPYDGKAHGITIQGVPDGAKVTYATSENGSYSNAMPTQTNVGTTNIYYKVTKENYKDYFGSATVTVTPAALPNTAELAFAEAIYSGTTIKPAVTIDGLKSDTDYTVSYSDNTAVGTAAVTITGCGNYMGSITRTFTILPKKPATAKAKLYGYDDVKFSWSKSAGASGYTVYYKKATSSKWISLGSTTKLYMKKANLSDGVKYSFKVVPYYKDGNGNKLTASGQYKTASMTTLKKVTLSSFSKSSGKVKVKWKDISGESGYQISKSTKKTGTYTVYKTIKANTTSKLVTATKGKTYWYKVRAYKTVDGKKIYGPWSTPKKYKR